MATMESLSGIATFVAVARSASFTKAGEQLGISKSAVGKAVSRLEQRLGVKLFHQILLRETPPFRAGRKGAERAALDAFRLKNRER